MYRVEHQVLHMWKSARLTQLVQSPLSALGGFRFHCRLPDSLTCFDMECVRRVV